jgi:hypothetical protein
MSFTLLGLQAEGGVRLPLHALKMSAVFPLPATDACSNGGVVTHRVRRHGH